MANKGLYARLFAFVLASSLFFKHNTLLTQNVVLYCHFDGLSQLSKFEMGQYQVSSYDTTQYSEKWQQQTLTNLCEKKNYSADKCVNCSIRHTHTQRCLINCFQSHIDFVGPVFITLCALCYKVCCFAILIYQKCPQKRANRNNNSNSRKVPFQLRSFRCEMYANASIYDHHNFIIT